MAQPVATLIGAALIAIAVLFLGRWDVAGGDQVVRLDRWTGAVTVCGADATRAARSSVNGSAYALNCAIR